MDTPPKARHRGEPVDPKPTARRRALDPITSPTNTVPLHRAVPSGHRRTSLSLATGGLMVLTTLTAPAAPADAPVEAPRLVTEALPLITADTAAKIHQDRVEVGTIKAPPPPPPVVKEAVKPAPKPVVKAAPAPAPKPVVKAAPKHLAPAAPAAPIAAAKAPSLPNQNSAAHYTIPHTAAGVVPMAGRAPIIAAAALAQLGKRQDCTMLATNSLAAAGIKFHGWPAGYFALGSQVSAAQAIPGDLIYYQNGGSTIGVAHIAVYVGNGLAVHGGWNGNQTVTFSAYVGSGPVFIRVR